MFFSGEVSEWLKEHAWKACIRSKPYQGFKSLPHRQFMFRIFLVFLQFPSSFFILMIPFAMALRGVDKKVWFLVFTSSTIVGKNRLDYITRPQATFDFGFNRQQILS